MISSHAGSFSLHVQYIIPIGTEFYPFKSSTEQTGSMRKTSVEIRFGDEEIIDTCHMDHPDTGEYAIFYQLDLNDKSSPFDSYLVQIECVIEKKSTPL